MDLKLQPKLLRLDAKQRVFVDEYLIDLNAGRAAKAAGYSAYTSSAAGQRLLANVAVKEAVDEALAERSRRSNVRADEVLMELRAMLMVDLADIFKDDGTLKDIHEMPAAARRCIASFEVSEIWEGSGRERTQVGVLKKVKLWSKDGAIDKLMRHLAMYQDKLELTGSVTLRDLLPGAKAEASSDDKGEPTLDDELRGEG